MVKNSSMRLLLLISTAGNLQVEGGDVKNACLNGQCREKVWTIAGPEFDDEEGIQILIKKALCGLKTSGRKFLELLADVLKKMGFNQTQHDHKVWIKRREDGHGPC